jgi:hypothetical protein
LREKDADHENSIEKNLRDGTRMKPNAQLQVRSVRAQAARKRTGHISSVLDAAGGKSGANDGVHSLGLGQTWNANRRRSIGESTR